MTKKICSFHLLFMIKNFLQIFVNKADFFPFLAKQLLPIKNDIVLPSSTNPIID